MELQATFYSRENLWKYLKGINFKSRFIQDGVHPRILTDGIELAKKECLAFLETFKTPLDSIDKVMLANIARTSISTKLSPDLTNLLVDIVVESILIIKKEE